MFIVHAIQPVVQTAVHGRSDSRLDAIERPTLHRHAHHIVACLIYGRGRYLLGKRDFMVEAPYLAVLPAGELDGNGLVGKVESAWASFSWAGIHSIDGLEVEVTAPTGSIRRPHVRPVSAGELTRCMSLFKQLILLSKRAEIASQLRAGAIVLQLVALWSEPSAAPDRRRILLYRDLIEQYAHDSELTLEKLASRVGMTPEYLSTVFRRETGVTPVAYREKIRIARAKELLATTLMPVKTIAREVGYADANYFARVFRRHTGVTPRAFAETQMLRTNIHRSKKDI